MSGSPKIRVLMIQRNHSDGASIRRVFDSIRGSIDGSHFVVETQTLRYASGAIGVILNLLTFSPLRADVYHVTGDCNYISLLLPRDRTLMTIHDLITIRRHTGLRNALLEWIYLRWPIRWVRSITAISRVTESELREFIFKIGGISGGDNKIKVIENPLTGERALSPRPRLKRDIPTVLHIGTAANKNLDRLIDAVAGSNYKLRVIGKLKDAEKESIRSRGIDLDHVESVGDDAMALEYQNCDVVSFCSTYEGFGLPIIEAQAQGIPVVTSNIDPMSAVAGNGALLVDPNDPVSIRKALDSVLSDEEIRRELIANGFQNVKRFEPATIAAEYQKLYIEIAEHCDDGVM